jgi:hypothetical protein
MPIIEALFHALSVWLPHWHLTYFVSPCVNYWPVFTASVDMSHHAYPILRIFNGFWSALCRGYVLLIFFRKLGITLLPDCVGLMWGCPCSNRLLALG